MKFVKFGSRKICRINYTSIVSIPQLWLQNTGLGNGDYVELSMMLDGSLLIKPAKKGDDDAKKIQ